MTRTALRTAGGEARKLYDVLGIVPSWRGQVRLAWLWLRFFVAQSSGRSDVGGRRITVRGPAGPVSMTVFDLSELKVVRELFACQEYVMPDDIAPRTIIDLGSNAGFSVLWFKARWPAARVVAVEAHPRTVERLRANVSHFDDVDVVHAAVTDRNGEVTLHSGSESWAAGVFADAENSQTVEVPAVTLAELVGRLGVVDVDLLKMDIEGSEVAVLRSSAEVLRHTRVLVFEYHQEHDPNGTLWSLLDDLHGFEIRMLRGDSDRHSVVTLVHRP